MRAGRTPSAGGSRGDTSQLERAASDDIASQVEWRLAVAKVHSAEGRQDEAERLAREAVEIVEETDYVPMRADALVVLARVLAPAADPRRR